MSYDSVIDGPRTVAVLLVVLFHMGRRARRILPALLADLLIFSVAAKFIFLSSDLERYAKNRPATLLSFLNCLFWCQGGYFGAASVMAQMRQT